MGYCATPYCFLEAEPGSNYCRECEPTSSGGNRGISEAAMQFSKLKPEAFSSNQKKGIEATKEGWARKRPLHG